MMKSKKLNASGLKKVLLASSLVLFLGVFGSTAFAQSDAGIVAPTESALVETAPASALTPEPVPPPTATAPALVPAAVVTAAEPAAKQTSLDKLSSQLMDILIPALLTIIGGLVTMLLNWFRKKTKLEVSDKQIAQWSMVAELAAARGGEWARNKVKTLAEGETLPGPDVLEVAANWGLDYGIAHGLPAIGREKLEGLIEGRLHMKRRVPSS